MRIKVIKKLLINQIHILIIKNHFINIYQVLTSWGSASRWTTQPCPFLPACGRGAVQWVPTLVPPLSKSLKKENRIVMTCLRQWFSTEADFALQGTFDNICEHFWLIQLQTKIKPKPILARIKGRTAVEHIHYQPIHHWLVCTSWKWNPFSARTLKNNLFFSTRGLLNYPSIAIQRTKQNSKRM